MIDKKMEDALNQQINEELKSAYIYTAMAADFESKTYNGMAAWMKAQAKEEMNHAFKIYGFINERGGKAVFKAIDEPTAEYSSPLEAFETAYKHEQFITSCIDKLADLAQDINDKPTQVFLQWFIDEQVEEEDNATTIVDKIKMVGGSPQGLYLLDKELGQRE